ncbi:hypothetical protein BKA57DRAFT_472061 [Linnemannia elongata]|nr:hypothetical protein BKA57DRAFT_472061 [Linnemannia elongata]
MQTRSQSTGPAGPTNPAHTSSYTNPLDLPEIIAQVGYFLTPWDEYSDLYGDDHFLFYPHDLLSCLLVSKTWYNAILPVIWWTYDGGVMFKIPNDIITRHSHLIRQVYSYIDHPGPFNCTQLLTVEIDNYTSTLPDARAVHRQLVHNNPNIKMLTWTGCDYNSPLLEADDFVGLSRLQHLHLQGWDVSNRNLFGALMAVSSSLTCLQMDMLTGLRPGDLSPLRRDCDDNPPMSAAEERLAFPCLRRLDIRFSTEGTCESTRLQKYFSGVQELEDLLFDCPQLECLSMDVPRRAELGGLAAILRDRSPVIRRVAIWGDNQVGEEQLAYFIGRAFTNGLVELRLNAAGLGIELAVAIATHAPTLEALHITTDGQMDDNGILELLVRGQRLRDISLCCTATTGGEDTLSVLSSQPWGCKDVEKLDLGFMITFESKVIICVLDKMTKADPIMKEWTYRMEYGRYESDQHVVGTPDMLRSYLGLIRGLSKLRDVYIGCVKFRRSP